MFRYITCALVPKANRIHVVVSLETHLCGPVARATVAAHWPVRTLLCGNWSEPRAGGSAVP